MEFLAYWYGGYGWWWWWIAFLVIFFLLPLGYGWGYRGWGPWYRRGRRTRSGTDTLPADSSATGAETGWGCLGTLLWVVLIIAIIWIIFAWGWGGDWAGRGVGY
jgi:hypothetical protein